MREYVPDNYDRFVVREAEDERLKRLRDKLKHEWDMEYESQWVDDEREE